MHAREVLLVEGVANDPSFLLNGVFLDLIVLAALVLLHALRSLLISLAGFQGELLFIAHELLDLLLQVEILVGGVDNDGSTFAPIIFLKGIAVPYEAVEDAVSLDGHSLVDLFLLLLIVHEAVLHCGLPSQSHLLELHVVLLHGQHDAKQPFRGSPPRDPDLADVASDPLLLLLVALVVGSNLVLIVLELRFVLVVLCLPITHEKLLSLLDQLLFFDLLQELLGDLFPERDSSKGLSQGLLEAEGRKHYVGELLDSRAKCAMS